MYKFLPFMTNDCSVGLYSEETNDIYHSAFGAVSEAYDKFVNPAFNYLDTILGNITSLKVLDICYGTGYNTKAFLTEFVNRKTNISLHIDCIDTDETLIKLSPLIKNKINLYDRLFNKELLYKNILEYNEAKKIINLKKSRYSNYKISDFANFILLKKLTEMYESCYVLDNLKNIICKRENYPFFDKNMVCLAQFIAENEVYCVQNKNKSPFVHNIYYKYISKQYKTYKNIDQNKQYHIRFYPLDIRTYIINTDEVYDIIFLDGFSPAKCPCIWSVDFFHKLVSHMTPNCLLLTYNTSAPVRNAMRQAGLYIGAINSDYKQNIGTVGSKNDSLILSPLSKAQEGLLNTKAGIPYRDSDLSLENGTILLNRKKEIDDSNLISSSKYLKEIKNEV